MTWVAAVILMTVALPALLARLAGGYPPDPVPELAALAPLAVLPAVAAVIIAAWAAWWLAALLAIPAALLVAWQLPPHRPARSRAAAGPSRGPESAPAPLGLRVFTVNAQGGAADPAAIVGIVRRHEVDVLAVQELTAPLVARLAAAGLGGVLPFSHLDPRPGARGTGLVGALAADAAPAGSGFDFGCAAGADRSRGRVSGDADCGASTRSGL